MSQSKELLDKIRARRAIAVEAKLTPMDRAIIEFKAMLAVELQAFKQSIAEAKSDLQTTSNAGISAAMSTALSSLNTKIDEAAIAQSESSQRTMMAMLDLMASKMDIALSSNALRFEEAMRTEKVIDIHRDSQKLMDYVTVKPKPDPERILN